MNLTNESQEGKKTCIYGMLMIDKKSSAELYRWNKSVFFLKP